MAGAAPKDAAAASPAKPAAASPPKSPAGAATPPKDAAAAAASSPKPSGGGGGGGGDAVQGALASSLNRAKKPTGSGGGAGVAGETDFDIAITQPGSRALGRIALASIKHNPRSAGPAGLRGFQCGALTPPEFREQLKRAFSIRLTDKEASDVCCFYTCLPSGCGGGALRHALM